MPAKKSPRLTHVDAAGAMRMVDVGDKPATRRIAVAEAALRMNDAARAAVHDAKKGDVLAAARVAGIMAAKRTSELIPLCHPLSLSHMAVDLEPTASGMRIVTRAESTGPTGVEMEAMTAAAVAALTLYDMLKSVDRAMSIEEVRLLEKSGGKSGDFKRT